MLNKKEKKYMRKALTIFLASACIAGLPACSGKGVNESGEVVQSQAASESIQESVAESGETENETKTENETESEKETESEAEQSTEDASEAESDSENDKEAESDKTEDDSDTLTDVYVGSKDLEEQADGKSPDTTVYTYSVRAADYNVYIDSIKKELDTAGGYIAKQDKTFYSIDEKKAYLVLRVPRDGSADFAKYIQSSATVDKSDHVTDKVKNMTSVIDDHVTALQQEQTNLLEMAVKTEDTSTVLSIQSRIADITYEINAYNSKMHVLNEDKQYDSIIINFTEDKDVAFAPRVNNFFRRFITGIGSIFTNVAVVFLAVLPIAALIALIVFIVTTLKKRQQEKENKQIADYAKRISEAKNRGQVVDGSVLETSDKKLIEAAATTEKETGEDKPNDDAETDSIDADSQEDSNDSIAVAPEADVVNDDIDIQEAEEIDSDLMELDEIEKTLNELDHFTPSKDRKSDDWL